MRYKAITGLDDDQITHLVDLLVQFMPWDPRRALASLPGGGDDPEISAP